MPPHTDPNPLGRQMLATLNEVTELLSQTTKKKEFQALAKQRTKLLEQMSVLIDKNLDQSSARYVAATEGLQSASEAVRKAIAKLATVAQAIQLTAKALTLVAKVAAA